MPSQGASFSHHGVELGDLSFELLVNVLRPANEAHRRQAETSRLQGGLCGSDDSRVAREPEVVVRAAWRGSTRPQIDELLVEMEKPVGERTHHMFSGSPVVLCTRTCASWLLVRTLSVL
jgi:hypothetical protein